MNYITRLARGGKSEWKTRNNWNIPEQGSAMSELEPSEEAKYCRREIPPSRRTGRRSHYLYIMRWELTTFLTQTRPDHSSLRVQMLLTPALLWQKETAQGKCLSLCFYGIRASRHGKNLLKPVCHKGKTGIIMGGLLDPLSRVFMA